MVFSLLKKVFGDGFTPATPDGERLYAVGDIHGRADLLSRLMTGIERDMETFEGERCRLIFLGDYIDRGPDSAKVIDMLIDLGRRFEHVHYLRGNHELAMRRFIDDPRKEEAWLDFGGSETIESYRVPPPMPRGSADQLVACAERLRQALPRSHMTFLDGLHDSLTFGDYFFVHAGIRPGVPLEHQQPEDLLWIRDEFLSSDWCPGKMVVHGHTPSEHPDIGTWRIGVDTGAYATGRLTCAVLEGTNRRFLATNRRRSAA